MIFVAENIRHAQRMAINTTPAQEKVIEAADKKGTEMLTQSLRGVDGGIATCHDRGEEEDDGSGSNHPRFSPCTVYMGRPNLRPTHGGRDRRAFCLIVP